MIIFKGLILGFSVAAPVGPIGLLCIQRTLNKGRLAGFLSGLGAATADSLYSCIAAFGFTLISQLLVRQQVWLHLIGGVFLIYLGIRIFIAKPSNEVARVHGDSLFTMYLSTLFLTITNPMTILAFVGMFAGLGVANSGSNSVWSSVMLVLSVFTGSAFWWLLLSGGVSLFKKWFDASRLRWVNVISGTLIAGLGLLSLVSV